MVHLSTPRPLGEASQWAKSVAGAWSLRPRALKARWRAESFEGALIVVSPFGRVACSGSDAGDGGSLGVPDGVGEAFSRSCRSTDRQRSHKEDMFACFDVLTRLGFERSASGRSGCCAVRAGDAVFIKEDAGRRRRRRRWREREREQQWTFECGR